MEAPPTAAGETPSSSTPSSNAEVKHLADRLNAAQVKVKRLHRLEAAIADMFEEMMDRTSTRADRNAIATAQDDRAAKRKEDSLKRAEGDALAVLNALRAHLRMFLASQDEQMRSLEDAKAVITKRTQLSVQEAMQEKHESETASAQSRRQVESLADQVARAEDEKDRISRHYRWSLEQLNTELYALRETHERQQATLMEAQQQVESLQRENQMLQRDRDRAIDESTRNPGNGQRSLADASATCVEQQNLRRLIKDYEMQMTKLEAQSDAQHSEIQRLQQEIAALRKSAQALHASKMEKDLKRYRMLIDESKIKSADQEAELLRTKALVKERDATIQAMKDEYNKLFAALQKIKQVPQQTSPSRLIRGASTTSLMGKPTPMSASPKQRQQDASPTNAIQSQAQSQQATTREHTRQQANENPYLLEHFKNQMEKQAKEMEQMQARLRKMMASEYRHKQKNRLFRVERVQLKDTCDRLRSDLDTAVLTSAQAMKQLGAANDADFGEIGGLAVSASDSQLCCSVADMRRLRERNLFLEDRFRNAAIDAPEQQDADMTAEPASDAAAPSVSAASAILDPDRRMEMQVPLRSINANTEAELRQSKNQRARPQSATALTARPKVRIGLSHSTIVPKSLVRGK